MNAMNSHYFNIDQTVTLNDQRTFEKVYCNYNGKRKPNDI